MSAALAEEIATLASRLGRTALEKACALLEAAPSGASAASLLNVEDEFAPWAAEALQALAAHEPHSPTLALALRSAAAGIAAAKAEHGDTELVWSGPNMGLPGVRSLEQALRDVILSAERTLWLVSFAAFHVSHLIAALSEVAARGVRIHFILESVADSAGQLSADARCAFAGPLLSSATFYSWPLTKRPRNAAGRPAKLHAKFALADSRTALISSANLTADGLERNIECGVLLRGGQLPLQLASQLERLAARSLSVCDP